MTKRMEFRHEEYKKHQCRSWQEGEWLYFQCPHCDFLRKMNWRSKEMETLREGDLNALHQGLHAPAIETIDQSSAN